MVLLTRQNLRLRAGVTGAIVGLLCTVAVVSGCNKGGDETAPPPPATVSNSGATGGAPPETAEQKKAEDASRAQVSAERAQHAPPGPK